MLPQQCTGDDLAGIAIRPFGPPALREILAKIGSAVNEPDEASIFSNGLKRIMHSTVHQTPDFNPVMGRITGERKTHTTRREGMHLGQ